jgi:phage terminase small subunit
MGTATADKPLNHRHARFAEEYVKDFKKQEAAIRAGFSPKSAHVTANRLLKNAKVQAAIAILTEEASKNARKSKDDILKELELLSFSNITDFIYWNESGVTFLKDSESIPRELAAAIESIEVIEESMPIPGTGQDGQPKKMKTVLRTKVKLHPKLQSIVNLMKHHGMLRERVEHMGSGTFTFLPPETKPLKPEDET